MDYDLDSSYREQEYSQEETFSSQEQSTDFKEECSNTFEQDIDHHFDNTKKITTDNKQSSNYKNVRQEANETYATHLEKRVPESHIAMNTVFSLETQNFINNGVSADYCDLESTPSTELDLTGSIEQDYVGDCSNTISESDSWRNDEIKNSYDTGPFEEYL